MSGLHNVFIVSMAGAVAVPVSTYALLRLRSNPIAFYWALAWIALFVSAFHVLVAVNANLSLIGIREIASAAFAVLTFCGAKALPDHPQPVRRYRWLIPIVALPHVVVLLAYGYEASRVYGGLVYSSIVFLAAIEMAKQTERLSAAMPCAIAMALISVAIAGQAGDPLFGEYYVTVRFASLAALSAVTGLFQLMCAFEYSEARLQATRKARAPLAGLMHDLNNYLFMVSARAEFLKDSAHSHSTADEIEKLIATSNRGMQVATQAMNVLSSPEDDGAISKEPIAASHLLEQVETNITHVVHEGIKLTILYPSTTLTILGNEVELVRLLTNLALNAIDAIGENGRIEITAGLASRDEVFFAVTDNGSGMDSNTLSKIFTPGFSTKNTGNGLGLSVCDEIASAHEGYVKVESEIGKGSTFELVLPKS